MLFTRTTSQSFWSSWIIALLGVMLASLVLLSMLDTGYSLALGTSLPNTTLKSNVSQPQCTNSVSVDVNWYAPAQSMINSLSSVINGSGVYDFIFNSSTTPPQDPYDTYNWCNMPHVRAQEYRVPDSDYELEYVEVIHRHHKRTPYAANKFPLEQQSWSCSDSHLYYYATADPDNTAAQINWQITPPSLQLFPPTGFPNSTCQFPQITAEGLHDSRQHGTDLRSVYIDLLHFLPTTYDPTKVTFRVTNNVITSQVASQVISALYPSLSNVSVPVTVQPTNLDSLEPQYPCPSADDTYSIYGVGSDSPEWLSHLSNPTTQFLFAQLDSISGVNTSDPDWHDWVDHYFDNLSSKLCHGKPLGCNITNHSLCITQNMADAIFRRGLYEYSYIYRDNPLSLPASTASFGVWLAELAVHIRGVVDPQDSGTGPASKVIYRHNIAHDGSISRLLSILQIDVMVWPGMGSEVVFELWRRQSSGCWFVRVLWKGGVLRSSNPTLNGGGGGDGEEEEGMIPVERFLGYVDGLVGVGGVKVPGLCTDDLS